MSTPTGSVFVYDSTDEPFSWLVERGVKVTAGVPNYSTGQMRSKMTEDELVAAASGHIALLGASGARITERVLRGLPDLRYISKIGIGAEVIDLRAASEHGVMVTNTPVHSEVAVVAEHAIALLLGITKHVQTYARDWLRSGRWKDPANMAGTLQGATVGIVGFGQIGRAVATRLDGWGARLIATDIRDVDSPDSVELVSLETLLRSSDYVTLHAPGRQPGAQPLLGAAQLDMLKPTAILVNTARGNLIDTTELTERLRDGRLTAAALDVFDPEPPDPTDPLLGLPNVLLTPHAAAWNPVVRKEMALMAYENLWTMLQGGTPEHLINPEVLDVLKVAR
jgi:D-3-phosphoglycerate dehydrogenase / 2-oxoglutarate reductase